MCENVMQTTRVRCPDCQTVLMLPVCWGCDLHPDEEETAALLREHAAEMPILHPTVLPEHHTMRRPA